MIERYQMLVHEVLKKEVFESLHENADWGSYLRAEHTAQQNL